MTEEADGPPGEAVTLEPAEQRHIGPNKIKVMLLGSGDSARELTIAFQRLGVEVIAVGRYAEGPAHGVADQSLVVETTDTHELTALIGRVRPDYVVALASAVAVDALTAATDVQVVPSARAIQLTADYEAMRRLAADELGLPTAPFWFANSVDELKAVAAHAGFPLLVKPLAAAAGQRQTKVSGPEEIEPAWQRAGSARGTFARNRVLAETAVEVDVHVTLLTVSSMGPAGPLIEFCAPIGHSEAGGDVQESWQPQQLSPAALDAGKSIAARIAKALGGRGVFAVQLMVRGDEVYFCDVTTRPCETALVTLRTQRLSLFELQARAVLGLAVDTIMISPGAAQVIQAGPGAVAAAGHAKPRSLADALAVPESDIRVFGDHEGDSRFGLALATAPDISAARDRSRQVSAALRRLRQG